MDKLTKLYADYSLYIGQLSEAKKNKATESEIEILNKKIDDNRKKVADIIENSDIRLHTK